MDMTIPWQARFLRGLRRPEVRTAALSVSRSNGKSWLAARLAADYLSDGAPDSECVIVADRYKRAELYDALNAARVPTRPVTLRGMGWRDGAEDVRRFRAAVFEGKVRAPRSFLLRSALSEARVLRDTAGSEKLAKGSQAGRRVLGRDDAAAALILAVAEGVRRGVPSERHGLRLVAV